MNRFRDLFDDEVGAVTVEFVAVLPAFVFFFAFFVDCCIVYMTYTDMYSTARDVARRMSTDELTTVAEIRDYVAERMLQHGIVYTVAADPTRAERSVEISIAASDAALFGTILNQFVGDTITARVTMRGEPLW